MSPRTRQIVIAVRGQNAAPSPERSPLRTFVILFVASCCAGVGAFAAGQLRTKLLGGLIVGVLAVVVIRMFKDRAFVLMVVGLPATLGFLLHKSFGTIVPMHDGGAPSLAITTLDVVVVVLWVMWWSDGTLRSDLRELSDRPIFWVPWIGGLLSLVSIVNATTLRLVLAEVLRWVFMYLLFVYIALHVRSRRDVTGLLYGLGGLAVAELGIIVLQWKTGGVLGLHFLGVPTALDVRTIDSGTIGRPFGSFTHPVFMAAIMGAFSLAALSLAIFLNGRLRRAGLMALGIVLATPMLISHTRSAALGYAVALPVLLFVGVRRGRITRRALAWLGAAVVVAVIAGWPVIAHYWSTDFHTQHFSEEVQARAQLNSLGAHIFRLHPIAGIGLNNFQQVMDNYNTRNLIFDGNPVHNLVLLQGSETGILGLAGMVFIGVVFLVLAIRLARSRDPLFAAIGTAVAVAYLFWYVEELLEFSLREDAPLALFWILAGLTIACLRIANAEAADASQLASASPTFNGNNGSVAPTRPEALSAATGNGSGATR
jgi:O-antigen ligase